MRIQSLPIPMAVLAVVLLSPPVFATIVYDLNYDSVIQSYDRVDNGGVPNKSYTSAGTEGSQAVQIDFDTTASPDDESLVYVAHINPPVPLATPTSAFVSDYEFSFDVKVEGLEAESIGGQAYIKLGDARFRGEYNATDEYSTVVFNLGDMTPEGAGVFDFADLTTSLDIQANLLGIATKFGNDGDNAVYFDNWRLTQISAVPEASPFAVLSLLGLSFAARFRRRQSLRIV